jgi:hypothetical protein
VPSDFIEPCSYQLVEPASSVLVETPQQCVAYPPMIRQLSKPSEQVHSGVCWVLTHMVSGSTATQSSLESQVPAAAAHSQAHKRSSVKYSYLKSSTLVCNSVQSSAPGRVVGMWQANAVA